ncbi:MAG: MscL family protein [Bacteroidota bacterium]
MVGEVYLEYGTFLTNVIDFIIVAFVMFLIICNAILELHP